MAWLIQSQAMSFLCYQFDPYYCIIIVFLMFRCFDVILFSLLSVIVFLMSFCSLYYHSKYSIYFNISIKYIVYKGITVQLFTLSSVNCLDLLTDSCYNTNNKVFLVEEVNFRTYLKQTKTPNYRCFPGKR